MGELVQHPLNARLARTAHIEYQLEKLLDTALIQPKETEHIQRIEAAIQRKLKNNNNNNNKKRLRNDHPIGNTWLHLLQFDYLWSFFFFTKTVTESSKNAIRLVLCKGKSDHVTPLLKQLHWLPIEALIHYKIATLAFRHFGNSLAPYLSERLQIYQPSRTLRSSYEKLLKVPPNQPKICRKYIFLLSGCCGLELSTNSCPQPLVAILIQNTYQNLFV